MCEGRGQLAIPTALQALKMLSDIYGHTNVRLTPAFLILAEAAIGESISQSVGRPGMSGGKLSIILPYPVLSCPVLSSLVELGSLTEASQYLSQAQWAVLKTSDQISPLVKSQLHRNLGQLAAARENYVEARKHFAEDVSYHMYLTSSCISPPAVM